jgi:hypothetical protein
MTKATSDTEPGTATKTVTATPYRQIRACYDEETITVYQAYNESIASAAVSSQKLNASPLFRVGRMTWIKPSWSWMLYRAGYSYKDKNQARILALKMKHNDFINILEHAVLTHGPQPQAEGAATESDSTPTVKVQWDPERSIRIGKLGHRSIQIGIPRGMSEKWVEEWIVGIEDVTAKARELKRVLDERADISIDELVQLGLVPNEKEFVVSKELQQKLEMVYEGVDDVAQGSD